MSALDNLVSPKMGTGPEMMRSRTDKLEKEAKRKRRMIHSRRWSRTRIQDTVGGEAKGVGERKMRHQTLWLVKHGRRAEETKTRRLS